MDLEDLRFSLDYGNTIVDAATMLCRDEDVDAMAKAGQAHLQRHTDMAVFV
jgi:hypothetical protein